MAIKLRDLKTEARALAKAKHLFEDGILKRVNDGLDSSAVTFPVACLWAQGNMALADRVKVKKQDGTFAPVVNAGSTANYTASGSSTTDSADLVTINPGGSGPFSMLVGTSVLYNANIYVMQASPLFVVVGGVLGSASGLMEVTLP